MLAIFALIAAAVAYVLTLRSLQPVPRPSANAMRSRARAAAPVGPHHLAFYRYPSTRKDITP